MSYQWYNENAQFFFENATERSWPEYYRPFIEYVPEGGHILDAGCGPGKDAKIFWEHGYTVSAFDASEELVKLAKEYTGLEIECYLFSEIEKCDFYDGIWASASLLHVSYDEMHSLFPKFIRALKVGGVWHMTFKYGEGEMQRKGRFFQDHTETSLKNLIDQFEDLSILNLEKIADSRPERNGEFWTRAVVSRMS